MDEYALLQQAKQQFIDQHQLTVVESLAEIGGEKHASNCGNDGIIALIMTKWYN